jgi:hypothetical protein
VTARMASFDELPRLTQLLRTNDLAPTGWAAASLRGFSGARIFRRADRRGAPFVLKVTSAHTDWIMRATSDWRCREAVLANTAIATGQVDSPAVGSAQDGAVFSILMRDISKHLLSAEPLTDVQLKTILLAMCRLHARTPPAEYAVPWCSVRDRLTLFQPDSAKLADFRIADDILRGWTLFFAHAPKDVVELVRSLFDDIAPMERALGRLPSRLLHGDLKLDNIGIRPDGTLSLIDWSMPMNAPAAIDLGWFMAMNSRVLPISLDDTMAAYAAHSDIDPQLHETHRSLTVLSGLLIRGWRKALDAASGDSAELHWWCERASNAATVL